VTREQAILLTLIVYMAVLLVIGLLAQRRTKDGADFFLGGRRLGPLVAAVGASASSSSVWTLLGVSGAAWAWGLSALWLIPACVGGFALNWFVLAPSLQRHSHRTGAMTIADVLTEGSTRRWRVAVRALAVFIIVLSLGAYIASQFQGAGKIFGTLFGIAEWKAILVGAAVVLLYTVLGGLWAVSLTDTLQGLMMALTAVVLPIAALIEVGGFEPLAAGLRAVPVEGYAEIAGPRVGILAVGFVLGILGIGLGYPGQPHVVKYFMALDASPGNVQRARRYALSWAVIIYCGMVLLGLCGRILFPVLADKERVFIEATVVLFPPIMGGIMIAAVLSAIMSTADSQLLVASSSVVHDAGLGGRSQRGMLVRSRLTVFVLTVAAAIAAQVGSKEIFSRVLFGWAAMGAAFGPLLIVRVVMRRPVSPPRVFAAMFTGFALSVAAHSGYADLFGTSDLKRFAIHVMPWVAAFAVALTGTSRSEGTDSNPA
jgi:sodium/proline symporter